MLTLDTTYRRTAGLTTGRIARLTLSLTMLAGTTQALAQNTGLGAFGDEPDTPAFTDDAGFEEADGDRPLGDLNFDVSVSEYDLVDLHVNNEDLGRVLQLLSIQSQRNIVASNSVEASVTADLYGVTFYEALDAILHVNGFGYVERGNFIYVYTREELKQIEEAARTRESRVFQLSHLNATDAGEFAKSMLSEGGSITTNAETEDFALGGNSPVGADGFASSATLVVWDYPENIDAIASLLAEIDTRPTQVLVEATILQTTLNEANAFGVDFAILNDMDFLDFVGTGGPLSVVNGLIAGEGETVDGTAVNAPGADGNGAAIGTSIGNIDGPATLKAGIVNEDVAVFLRVLDQVTDVTVVSNPKILTLNRMPARVLVGTKVGYLNTTTTETATTQTVEFLDTGTQLSVRPFVSSDGGIRLELKPQVSSAQLREVADNNGNTVTIPDEDTSELTTNILLRDGQTAVLGGLFTETTTATRRQVPLLGDIPLIGSAFRGHDDQTRRNEIIFLVTPSIVNDAILDSHGELASAFVENTRVGARKGTLPFSRDRRVSRLLIEARRHADAGETDMAIFKVQKALGLAPMSADARMLLEQLTSEKVRRPSRSLMEGVFHRELLEPMPGVISNEGYFTNPFLKRPSTKAQTTETAAKPAPANGQWVAPPVSTVTFGDGATAEIVNVTPEGGAVDVFEIETGTNSDDSWIRFDEDPAFEDEDVAEVPGEELSFNDDTFPDDAGFEYEWVSPEYDQAFVTEDRNSDSVADSGSSWTGSPVPTPANPAVISIESIDSTGAVVGRNTWSAPAAAAPAVAPEAEAPTFDAADAGGLEDWDFDSFEAEPAPVQLADAGSWEFGGPEAFEFDDEQFNEFADQPAGDDFETFSSGETFASTQTTTPVETFTPAPAPAPKPAASVTTTPPVTGATIVIESIPASGEQSGGRTVVSNEWKAPAEPRDPVAMTDEQLELEYALDGGNSLSLAQGSSERFAAPVEDVLSVIVSEPASKPAPAAKAAPAKAEAPKAGRVSPLEAMTLKGVNAANAAPASGSGFLVVPMPTGGVVQIPWPMQDASTSDGVRWREFTSVPVDTIDTDAFDALDR